MRACMKRFMMFAAAPMLAMAALQPVPAGAVAPSAVDEVVVRPSALARGAVPGVSWLSRSVAHTTDGRTRLLPWSGRAAVNRYLTLVAPTAHGWVVTDHQRGIGSTAWLVDREGKNELAGISASSDEHTWMVARDGTAVLGRGHTEGDPVSVEVTRISDGERLDSRTFDGPGEVLDFSGPQALIGVAGDTVLWEPGGVVEPLGTEAVAGDLLHDVLVVPGTVPGTVGPTTISDPGTPGWTAPLDRVEVSPDGGLLLGHVTAGPREGGIEIRRVVDGVLVAAFDLRNVVRVSVQWERRQSIVFIAENRADEHALVRCRVDGRCNRATAWRDVPWYSLSMARARPLSR